MTRHHGALNNLLDEFIKKVELVCGTSLYVQKLTGQRWGVYKYPGHRGNICNIIERARIDADFPRCPLPHLKIVTGNALARKAGAKPDLVMPGRWHGRDAAYWCINTPGSAQFTRVAGETSKLCPYVK
jgi:hypothetical protein